MDFIKNAVSSAGGNKQGSGSTANNGQKEDYVDKGKRISRILPNCRTAEQPTRLRLTSAHRRPLLTRHALSSVRLRLQEGRPRL